MSATVKCSECNKTVYPLEKVSIADGRNFHKACFKCFTCKSSLRPGQHFVHDTKIYCKPHYAAVSSGQTPRAEETTASQESTPRAQEPIQTHASTEHSTPRAGSTLYAQLEAEHNKKPADPVLNLLQKDLQHTTTAPIELPVKKQEPTDPKKDLADIEAQVQRALSHSRSSSSMKSLNLSTLSPRPSPSTSSAQLTATQEPPPLMEEITALVSPRVTAEEEDEFFKEQMTKLEQEEEAKKKNKTGATHKTHSPRKSEDYQKQKEEKLKALKEKKALRMTGQSNDVANVNLSAHNNTSAETTPRSYADETTAQTVASTTIEVTADPSNATDTPVEGTTRNRKGSWALKPTSTTRRGSLTGQAPVVVGEFRAKSPSTSNEELKEALDSAKDNNTNHVSHEVQVVDPVSSVQNAMSIVDKSISSVESFFASLGVEKPREDHVSKHVAGGSDAEQFIDRVAQIKATDKSHNAPAKSHAEPHSHQPSNTNHTLNSAEFDEFVNKIEEIKTGTKGTKSNKNNNNAVATTSANNATNSNNSGRDPHYYYWEFLKNPTTNPEPASGAASNANPQYYYWEFLSHANKNSNSGSRRGSWAVKPTGTGRRGSVTSGEFRTAHNNTNTQSTQ